MIKRLIAFSSLFPNETAPNAGIFIKERLVRLARHVPVSVIAPVPWSPFDALIRLRRPGFRPRGVAHEVVDGLEIFRPRVLSFPGLFKRLDGWFMARGTFRLMKTLAARGPAIVDGHFLYPDGYAATRNARRLGLASVVTLRGSKDRLLMGGSRESGMRQAARQADHLICVSQSLIDEVALRLVDDPSRITLVGNGVDLDKFQRQDRSLARQRLNLAADDRILLSVGNLIPLKGFDKVIACMPALIEAQPRLKLVIVGSVPTGDSNIDVLHAQIRQLGLEDRIIFKGRQTQEELSWFYSAADLFVLATAYEGWANVFLEAMACGLPVISTRVGGNAEVVCSEDLGTLVEFWDPDAFIAAVKSGLLRSWDREALVAYARANQWDRRIEQLLNLYGKL